MKPVDFGGRLIGEGHPAFVIAEAGVNHNGDLELGKRLIREAKRAGADAIKFQSYKAGKISTRTAPRYWVEPDDPQGSQFDTFRKLDSFGREEHEALFSYAKSQGLLCFSAPFDDEAVDMLDELGAPGFKIASADLTDHPLLEKVASKNKPVILSTGLATIAEIGEAVEVLRKNGNDQIILLHCTLQYPCEAENANLRMMLHMKASFPEIPVGLSDHTLGIAVPQAAVALGAVAVEKHYTVDKTLPGSPDHHLSVDPPELERMMQAIRTIEKAMGRYEKGPVEAEAAAYRFARRSIVSVREISAGTEITRDMLTFKRPGTGIYPKFSDVIVGRVAKVTIPEDTVLEWSML
ncbi:MAG TPA: N-acetylneuraminate synthase family protein [Vicinamibacteria bacterium]|nr:N-acetylneuraminate synthase family protein [Vicinamibacteria bacterium]